MASPDAPGGSVDDHGDEAAVELADLGVEPSSQFLGKVRRRLGRRLLTSHVLDLSISGTAHVVVELTGLVMGLIERPRRQPPG